MSLPVFFPQIKYLPKIDGSPIPLHELCTQAGVKCEAIGAWTERPIVIEANSQTPFIQSEPGDWGRVKIATPLGLKPRDRARWALGALAYTLFDGVARASIAGKAWARATTPRGRKPTEKRALTTGERQRKFRAKVQAAGRGL